jgi:DNA-binding NtrC family response regulator
VDDDRAQSHFLSAHLMRRSYDVSSAATGDEAIRMFRVFDPALVLLDADARGMEGMETLERLKQIKPDVSVIMTASSGAPEMIFRASKLGADDFMAKPIDLPALDQRMARLLDGQRLTSEVTQLRDHVRRQSDGNMLFGTSPKMEDVKTTIEQVADTNATVLIRGESGTGKEVVARMVFSHSLRSEKPFVKVNCAAIPHELLESELFGYEPGAFTGANRPMGVRSSWMKSARCIRHYRRNFCTFCRMADSRDLEESVTSRSMSGCWPQPTNSWNAPWRKAFSAKICSTA